MNRFSAYNVYDKFSEILPKGSTEDAENLEVFQELLDEGHTKNEVHLFISLLVGIESLDAEVINSDDDISIIPIESPDSSHTAAYFYKDDFYGIYIDNLFSRLKRATPSIFFDQNYRLFIKDKIRGISIEDVLIMTSAHEVRHRLQYKSNLSLFSLENREPPKYKKLIERYAHYYENIAIPDFKNTLRLEGKSEEYIKNKTGKYEVDALIVTGVVASRIYQGASLDEIIEIIKLSPNGGN